MKHLEFLIKPVSSACNMRCAYCFYEDITNHRSSASAPRMSDQTVHRLLSESFSLMEPDGSVHFAFQGGEPTLAGLDFYIRFVRLLFPSLFPCRPTVFCSMRNGQTYFRNTTSSLVFPWTVMKNFTMPYERIKTKTIPTPHQTILLTPEEPANPRKCAVCSYETMC